MSREREYGGNLESNRGEERLAGREEVYFDNFSLYAFARCLGNLSGDRRIMRESLGHPAKI